MIGWINQMLSELLDPRRETRNTRHERHDMLMIVLCAVLSGMEDWVGMEALAEEKEAWLRGFLDLPNGMPSHDTLSDVPGRIDPVAFRGAFTASGPSGRSQPCGTPGPCLCRPNALSAGPAGGSGDIQRDHRHPGLLALLDLTGAVVSLDAMGCRKAIAQTTIDAGASSKGGMTWRLLPNDFPLWKTVYGHFSLWNKNGIWTAVLNKLDQFHR